MEPTELRPYLGHLRALPFVRGVRVLSVHGGRNKDGDFMISIRGRGAARRMLVDLKKSHVSPEVIERWAAGAKRSPGRILLAPAISQRLGDRLATLDLAFMDRAGNCYLSLAGNHVARIQGNRMEKRGPGEKAFRAPAYRALFALLADPTLVAASVRALAEAAGVSRQAAQDIRPRLEGLGILYTRSKRFGWVPRGVSKALDLFVTGYKTTLRPALLLGRYRVPGADPGAVEQTVRHALSETDKALWGGGAAAMKLTRYYRGERVILHADQVRPDFLKRAKAIPDRHGTVEIVRFAGPLGRAGATNDTAHPVQVYAELLLEGHDRASEAAHQILERWFPPERYV